MNCKNHPNKEGIATCTVCGNVFCDNCILNIAGKDYCEKCVTDIVIKSPKSENDNIEKKHEKYLDELYDESEDMNKLSVQDQLAIDESVNGPVIDDLNNNDDEHETISLSDISESNINGLSIKKEDMEHKRMSLHRNISKDKKKSEESTTTEIILTIILLIMIFVVVAYIIFLFVLSNQYNSFFDAIYALFTNPNEIISKL